MPRRSGIPAAAARHSGRRREGRIEGARLDIRDGHAARRAPPRARRPRRLQQRRARRAREGVEARPEAAVCK